MGAGASAELSKDQLKEKYCDVKHRLYPQQQADVESKFEATPNPAEILECVNNHLNNPEVPNMNFDEKPTFTDKHKSLMAKHLTPDLFAELMAAGATSKGYTVSRAIQTGYMTPHLGVGITAGDEESWELFKGIYYPIIKGWHGFDPESQNHVSDLDPSKLTMTDAQVRCRTLELHYLHDSLVRDSCLSGAVWGMVSFAMQHVRKFRDRGECGCTRLLKRANISPTYVDIQNPTSLESSGEVYS